MWINYVISAIAAAVVIGGVVQFVWDMRGNTDGCGVALIAAIVAAAIAVGLVWAISGGASWLTQSIHGNSELHFTGKVVNSETGEWLNQRLVLVFLRREEIARTTSDLGEFRRSGFGIHDGYFDLEVPNTYRLEAEHLHQLGFKPSYVPWWTYFEIGEGNSREFPVPEKNIVYVVRVVPGDISSLPPPMLVPGSIHLSETGEMIVQLDPNAQPAEAGQILVQAIRTRSETEELVVSRITIPLDNCGGSAPLEYEHTQTHTFMHEYSVGVGGGIGSEIGIPGLPVSLIAELEAEYGFTQGEVSSRSISYHMSAEPGTNQVYVITWKEVWEKGEADIMVGGQPVTVDFEVRSDLIYQVDSEARSCP